MIRTLLIPAALGLALLLPGHASAQTAPADGPTQTFLVPFRVQGQPVAPNSPFTGHHDYPLIATLPRFTPTIGGFFDLDLFVVDLGEFGIGAQFPIDASGGVDFNYDADLGVTDVNYPIHVTIQWPSQNQIMSGQTFPVSTSYTVDPAASMQVHGSNFHAALNAVGTFNAAANLKAEAFGDDLFSATLFDIHLNRSQPLFDTDDYLDGTPHSLFDGAVTLTAQQPDLDASGTLLTGGTLESHGVSPFVTSSLDLTKLVADAFGIGDIVANSYSFADYNLSYSLLALTADTNLNLDQTCDFTPLPEIEFTIKAAGDYQSTSGPFPIGQTVPLQFPRGTAKNAIDHVQVTACIIYKNQFRSVSSLNLTPRLEFVPIDIEGSGSVAGIDLPDISFKPLDAKVPLFNVPLIGFTDTPGQIGPETDITEAPYTLKLKPLMISGISPVSVPINTEGQNLAVSGTADGIANANTFLEVIGDGLEPIRIPVALNFSNGSSVAPFGATIPAAYLKRAAVLTLRMGNIVQGEVQYSNPLTVTVQPAPLSAQDITFTATQSPLGQAIAAKRPAQAAAGSTLTASGGPITITGLTRFFPTDSVDAAFVSPDAVLTFNGTAVATTVTPTTIPNPTAPPTAPQFLTYYLLQATVPNSQVLDGGAYTLGFQDAGGASAPLTLGQATVNYQTPALDGFYEIQSLQPGETRLALTGRGFSPHSQAFQNILPLATTFVSSGLLYADIPTSASYGGTALSVTNPSPGGGASASLTRTVAVPTGLILTPANALYPAADGGFSDVVAITNAGSYAALNVHVTQAVLVSGAVSSPASSGPTAVFPVLDSGKSGGLVLHFPATAGVSGQTAVIRISGTASGKNFVLTQRVTLP